MRLFDFFLDLIYPRKCVFCGKVLEKNDICDDCIKNLPYTNGEGIYQKFAFVKKCVSPLYYEGKVRDSIIRYKFMNSTSYSVRYGAIMSECVENNLDCGSIDVISYVPLSRKRLRRRGYNQAQLIAGEISSRLDIPCMPVLRKIKNNPAQSKTRNSKQRAKNVSGVYEVLDPKFVKDKCILLIDDVVTTGSTLSECARMLGKASAKTVFCATLARHRD